MIPVIARLASRRGSTEWGLGSVVIVICLIAGYLMFPEDFHRFVQYILNTVFDALRDSFGSDVQTPTNGSGEVGSGTVTVPEYRNLP